MPRSVRALIVALSLALVVAACGDTASDQTTSRTVGPVTTATTPTATGATTAAPATTATTEAPEGGYEVYNVTDAAITVDGDPSDWDAVPVLDLVLRPIEKVSDMDDYEASVQVAHHEGHLFVLFAVEDDYDFTEGDPHLTGSPSVAWAVDSGAGVAMGATEEDQETSLGLVDIWHWEVECSERPSGGALYPPGDGKPAGNDDECNFDDEYATSPDDREDDDMAGAENSLMGAFSHTAGVNGEAGTWYFEMSRPFATGDAGDAQFALGSTGLMALAYWDADQGPDGWEDDGHVQSTGGGWIPVLIGG